MFQLDTEQSLRLGIWLREQHRELAKLQWQDPELREKMLDENTPYLGAIGGGLTYEFTPTGLGTVVVVYFRKGSGSEAHIDLTDYDMW